MEPVATSIFIHLTCDPLPSKTKLTQCGIIDSDISEGLTGHVHLEPRQSSRCGARPGYGSIFSGKAKTQ